MGVKVFAEPVEDEEWGEFVMDFPEKPNEIPQRLFGKKVAVSHAYLHEQTGSLQLRAHAYSIWRTLGVAVLGFFVILFRESSSTQAASETAGFIPGLGVFSIPVLFVVGISSFFLVSNWLEARKRVRLSAEKEKLALSVFGISWEVSMSDLYSVTEVIGRMKTSSRLRRVRQIGILWQMDSGDFRMEPVLTIRLAKRHESLAQDLANRIGVPLMRPPESGYLSHLDVPAASEA